MVDTVVWIWGGITKAAGVVAEKVTGTTIKLGITEAVQSKGQSLQDSEKSFREVGNSFENLQKCSLDVHQCCVSIKSGINHTRGLVEDLKVLCKKSSTAMITDVFDCLYEACNEHQQRATKVEEELKEKKDELQKLINDLPLE